MKDYLFSLQNIFINNVYRVRFTWDQVVSVRPVRQIFFTWNITSKQCEGKKNSNIHSKNTIKVTFTVFFDVKVRFFVTFTGFSLWRFGLFIFYLHNIFAVKVSFFYLALEFFYLEWIFGILFTFTVFCSKVSCFNPWSHVVSRKQLGLTWSHGNSLVSRKKWCEGNK